MGSFSLSNAPIQITRWDVAIPQDWEYGQWSQIHLFPVQVNTYRIKCSCCGAISRAYPSFTMSGTTLTLQALVFVAYVYSTSTMTWRDMPEKFCPETDRIAHSTLYKAVHGLGKSFLIQADKVQPLIQKLHAGYAHALGKVTGPQSSGLYSNLSGIAKLTGDLPHFKARLPQACARESAIHDLILPLSLLRVSEPLFLRAFFVFMKPVRFIQSSLSPPIHVLYPKACMANDALESLAHAQYKNRRILPTLLY